MPAPSLVDLARWLDALGETGVPGDGLDDVQRIDLITQVRRLEHAAVAAQTRLAHDFDESRRAQQRAAGVHRDDLGKDVANAVALARRESPARTRRFLGLSRILATEMPHTARALARGDLDEWSATLVARETATLPLEVRTAVDTELVGSGRATQLSRKALVDEARSMAIRLDNAGVADRRRLAERDRRVTIRPAPDTMVYVTALVPVAQGVAVHATLTKAAATAIGEGDDRGKGQIMADTLVELVTGRVTEAPPPVELHLVMTDRTLLGGADDPAHLPGYGVVPADWACDLVGRALTHAAVWIKRLYVAPGTGDLMAMDSRRRKAPTGLRGFIEDRDRLCRTPYCGAPVKHIDHAEPYRDDPQTTAAGLQGLCEHCNYAKEAIGWRAVPRAGPPHCVEITTPTGHTYLSFPPPPLVGDGWDGDDRAA